MRIIAGTHRGRKLLPPVGDEVTRPITDRVKQSLFDRLSAMDKVEGADVLDVFAGTGSLGIECLSRGAVHVTFIEQDRSAAALLEENIATLREQDKSRIVRSNALNGALAMSLPKRSYGLIFVDPPYAMVRDTLAAPRLWKQLAQLYDLASEGAWLVLRLETLQPVPQLDRWIAPEVFPYGSMTVVVYKKTMG